MQTSLFCVVLVCSWSHLWIKCHHNTGNSGPLSATIAQKKTKKNLHSLQKEKFGKPHAMLEGNGVLCTWRWNVKIILGSVCVCFFFFVEGGGAKIMPVLFQYTT